MHGILSIGRLLHVVTKKYDTKMSSQISRLRFYSLATILTKNGQCLPQMLIPPLRKQEMTVSPTYSEDVNIIHYFGPKKPPMPSVPEVNLNDTFIHMQEVRHARAQMIDFQFFKDVATKG